jgi:hypothetical protein
MADQTYRRLASETETAITLAVYNLEFIKKTNFAHFPWHTTRWAAKITFLRMLTVCRFYLLMAGDSVRE